MKTAGESALDLEHVQLLIARAARSRRTLIGDPYWIRVAERHITGGGAMSPVEQLEVYREQFWLRHTSCLLEDYSALAAVLGQARWERLAEEYLEQIPPRSFTLRDLGTLLPEFVATREWLPQPGVCRDLALLERAYVDVFDAPDAPPLDPQRLVQLSSDQWEIAALRVHPALRVLQLDYPVAELRRELRAGKVARDLPERQAQALAVYRDHQLSVCDRVTTPFEAGVLEALARGRSIVQAVEQALPPEAEERLRLIGELPSWFAAWAEQGHIVDVVMPERAAPPLRRA